MGCFITSNLVIFGVGNYYASQFYLIFHKVPFEYALAILWYNSALSEITE